MEFIKYYLKTRIKFWLILATIFPMLVPHVSYAAKPSNILNSEPTTIIHTSLWPDYQKDYDGSKERWSTRVIATAYNSEVGQTDSTPFTTASNTTVRDGIIATNALPFGTKVRFPDLYGNKIFTVEDRMNARYTTRVDIWMVSKEDAKHFGKRYIDMEIL